MLIARISRVLPTALALAFVLGCSSGTETGTPPDHTRVETTSGPVIADIHDSVKTFRDIPYAQPPVNDLRWRAPRPVESSSSEIVTRDTVACLQIASDVGGVPGEGVVGTEDCLYLDITAPSLINSDESLPVMFWIHGGGNTSGYKGYYDFSTLVETENVIVVTINYRLGPFGWFSHPAVQGSAKGLDRSSNFGTLDIIQALKWVQNNIEKFGGDPDNVTVFGESAGGHNVFALLVSPLSDGLFHKAISQSGYLETATVHEAINQNMAHPEMRRSSSQLFSAMVDSGELAEVSSESIYGVPGARLLEHYTALDNDGDIPLSTADGIVLPKEGMLAALADSTKAKNVPVIAGANRDEVTLWLGTHRYFVDADYLFTRLLPPRLKIKNPELYDFWTRIRSDAWKVRGVDEPLAAMETAGYPDLYAYRFDWDDQEDSFFADFPKLIGAAHGIDIAFVTGNYTYGPISSYIYPDSESREEMREIMMSAWAGFARTGKPGLPIDWPTF
ncbi:MAG: carboxylesterase family protein, partial [Halieaceae bacterium]|nr:carboxylesterase family protein [Halieaceae bacterium]